MEKNKLLALLPPYKNKVLLINDSQDTSDIIDEVLNAHKFFSADYDQIAVDFYKDDVYTISENLFEFCKENIKYKIETDADQTTRSPAAILALSYGDCKHFAGFIAGVLDAINRHWKKIDWIYCFASYKKKEKDPQHVFVIVNLNGYKIWIDPVLDFFDEHEPAPDHFQLINPNEMSLNRISGLNRIYGNKIGIATELVSLRTNAIPNLSFDVNGQWPYPSNPFPNYLSLDKFYDYYGDRNINESSLADQINTAIAKGMQPGHTVTPDFVKWIYNNSIRGYNFYFAGGIDPNFDYTKYLPASFSWKDSSGHTQTIKPPQLVVTTDGRLTFDHDVKLDDYKNYLIHILTAGTQLYINKLDAAPFPLKPADLKIFSQSYTGNPNNTNADLLHEHRGTAAVQQTLTALNDAVNIVKDDVLKVTIAVPRNAFLLLIRLNLFHFATHLQEQIANGKWPDISKKWQNLGGDPNKLKNTIDDGAAKPGVDDPNAQNHISQDDINSISGIGQEPISGSAILASATAIILAMLQWLQKSAAAKNVANNSIAELNAKNPGANYSIDPVTGQVLTNGAPVSITGSGGVMAWIQENPLMAAGAAIAIYFLFFNKK